jgi:hypothetical protein
MTAMSGITSQHSAPSGWRWARRELSRLDPYADAERMTHLVLEVRYGDPVFTSALYTVAFMRQMSVPHIADVLYRGGRGVILTATRQRNDDTMTFFGEFLRLGHSSPQGREVIERLNAIHSRFPITNDQSLYTLSSLCFEAERIPGLFGFQLLTRAERVANFRFWRGAAHVMNLTDVPESYESFHAWTLAYERSEYGWSAGGETVARAMIDDWARRWLPESLLEYGRTALLTVCDDLLLDTLHLAPPSATARRLAGLALRGYQVGRRVLPDPAERSWSDHFGHAYGGRPAPSELGPVARR